MWRRSSCEYAIISKLDMGERQVVCTYLCCQVLGKGLEVKLQSVRQEASQMSFELALRRYFAFGFWIKKDYFEVLDSTSSFEQHCTCQLGAMRELQSRAVELDQFPAMQVLKQVELVFIVY